MSCQWAPSLKILRWGPMAYISSVFIFIISALLQHQIRPLAGSNSRFYYILVHSTETSSYAHFGAFTRVIWAFPLRNIFMPVNEEEGTTMTTMLLIAALADLLVLYRALG